MTTLPPPYQGPRSKPTYVVLPNGCWQWVRGRNGGTYGGYGKYERGGRVYLAHRFYYEHHRGPIPEGLQLDHLCRNKLCVNPDHLEPVTNAENTRRGIHSKLTAAEVAEIKALPNAPAVQLARRYDVDARTICGVRSGRSWQDIEAAAAA